MGGIKTGVPAAGEEVGEVFIGYEEGKEEEERLG